MAVGGILNDMEFSDFGVGGPMLGAETVGFDLANALLGGPEQGGLYTGGVGGGSSRTEAERQQAILDVNPYVAPSQGVNPNPITSLRSGGQTGYYFANELGLPARYGDVGLPQAANPATFDPNARYAASAPGFVPVDQNASYRLVRGGENGDVVYSGAGEEGLRNVFQQANKLTLDDPKNAYWGVEVLDPATGQYKRVAENQGPNGLGIVGDIAGVALPIAAAIATGGASLGVQIAAGAAAGGLGGFLAGKDPLTSALIAGATAGLGNVTGFNEAVGGVLSNAGDAVKSALIPEVAKQAATEAGGDIVVNALSNLAKGTASGLLQSAAAGATSGGSPTPAQSTPMQQPVQEPVQPPAEAAVKPIVVSGYTGASGSGLPFASAVPVPIEAILNGTLAQPLPQQQPAMEEPITEQPKEDIVVSAYRPINPVGGFDPTSVSKDIAGIGGSVLAALPALANLPMDPALTARPEPQAVTPDTGLLGTALGGLPALANLPSDPSLTQPSSTSKFDFNDVLGTGLNVPQLLSLGSVGADLLQNLLAGGDGAGAGVSYVSPFGTGVGIGAGRDMRATPNITDYERYGFGPEAMFFQPGYGLLSTGAAPTQAPPIMTAPQAQPAMVTNPRYEPLI
jgi:hypothetical protein